MRHLKTYKIFESKGIEIAEDIREMSYDIQEKGYRVLIFSNAESNKLGITISKYEMGKSTRIRYNYSDVEDFVSRVVVFLHNEGYESFIDYEQASHSVSNDLPDSLVWLGINTSVIYDPSMEDYERLHESNMSSSIKDEVLDILDELKDEGYDIENRSGYNLNGDCIEYFFITKGPIDQKVEIEYQEIEKYLNRVIKYLELEGIRVNISYGRKKSLRDYINYYAIKDDSKSFVFRFVFRIGINTLPNDREKIG